MENLKDIFSAPVLFLLAVIPCLILVFIGCRMEARRKRREEVDDRIERMVRKS